MRLLGRSPKHKDAIELIAENKNVVPVKLLKNKTTKRCQVVVDNQVEFNGSENSSKAYFDFAVQIINPGI